MQATATDAIDAAFKNEIMAQLTAIEDASARAVAAADGAADRLMRQLITIMDTSASVEQRVSEAEQAIAASDRDSLAKQVGLLTEALKSTAIDVTKILSSEVSDTAWDAYLKGDRGVFARRAVKLIENSEAKEILRLYQSRRRFPRLGEPVHPRFRSDAAPAYRRARRIGDQRDLAVVGYRQAVCRAGAGDRPPAELTP
jgi:hypothetical protein